MASRKIRNKANGDIFIWTPALAALPNFEEVTEEAKPLPKEKQKGKAAEGAAAVAAAADDPDAVVAAAVAAAKDK